MKSNCCYFIIVMIINCEVLFYLYALSLLKDINVQMLPIDRKNVTTICENM